MNYLVLARRTRPQSLNELIGQNAIRDALKGMLESKKIPHAFLFSGSRGTGKTSTARILAKSLNCEQGSTITPCQTCTYCKQITSCAHEDVLEMDAASHTGVDNIRELRESAYFYPVSAQYKIFIIDEVHMLSSGAFNALLKILEEPPAQVVFILATTELHKIPVTIRSRCLTFGFKKIDHLTLIEHLKKILNAESISFDDDALVLIAREAQGSIRDALSLLEQALALRTSPHLTSQDTKQGLGLQNGEIGFSLFSEICQKNATAALNILATADHSGVDLSLVVEMAANYCRTAIVLKSTEKNDTINSVNLINDERVQLTQLTKHINISALSEIFKLLSISVKDIQRASNSLNWAEVAILDAINRTDWLSASETLLKLQNSSAVSSTTSVDMHKTSDEANMSLLAVKNPSVTEVQHATTQLVSKKIDMDLYKKFISAAKKRSQTLAARLNFVQLEEFNQNKIKFANTAENTTYLAFDAKDQKGFEESLEEIGLSSIFKEPSLGPMDKSVSLHETEANEKKKAFLAKEKEILNRESVQNLMLLTKEIQLTPIEN